MVERTVKGRQARKYFEALIQLDQKRIPPMEQAISAAQALSLSAQTLDDQIVQTVNARSLHAFLGVGKVFRSWMSDRIKQHEFIEGQDFVCTQSLRGPNLDSSKSRAQWTKEFALTVKAAKELSMVERTPKGKEARQYFETLPKHEPKSSSR